MESVESGSVLCLRAKSCRSRVAPLGPVEQSGSAFVPLSMPALQVLARLADRHEFIEGDDYVLCNRWGRRIDASALRRRYKRAGAAAELRPFRLHGLRHSAGSLIARTTDAVFVRDFLGHAKLSTTDRYLSAKLRPEELERLDRAFETGPPHSPRAAEATAASS
jgi:site-specific recombinase XerD